MAKSVVFPEECFVAFINALKTVYTVQTPEDLDLNALDSYMKMLCIPQCMEPLVYSLECSGSSDLADFYDNGYCGQSSGVNCYSLWLAGLINGSVVSATRCAIKGTCNSDCHMSLQETADYLGCCAASFYNTSVGFPSLYIPPEQFATCNITLGAKCTGVVNAGDATDEGAVTDEGTTATEAGVDTDVSVAANEGVFNHVGPGLLTVFIAVATFTSAFAL